MRRAGLLLGTLFVVALSASDTAAFTIQTGFSEGCHEGFATQAFLASRAVLPVLPDELVPSDDWEGAASAYLPDDVDLDRGARFFLYSLVLGVRAPDTEGHSITNAQALRAAQADPGTQYAHCLRGPDDDYVAGDASALLACRAEITTSMERAMDALTSGGGHHTAQVQEVYVTLDAYGAFETKVWLPAYHLGRALHTLQDSFSHALRDAPMRRVVHVMNYEAALAGHRREERDGLAHAMSLDRCALPEDPVERELQRVRLAAVAEASAQLLRVSATLVRADVEGPEPTLTELSAVLDGWLTLAPPRELGPYDACTVGNDYCGSAWLGIARRQPTTPVLSCGAGAPGPRVRGGVGGGSGACAALALWLWFRSRSRRRSWESQRASHGAAS